MTTVVLVLVVVVALLALLVVVGFNRLRAADVRAQEGLSGIDVQLTRRAELVPNLVESVRGYAAHEQGVLSGVTAARAGVQAAAAGDDVTTKAAADAELGAQLVRVDAVAEAYPELRADESFGRLQSQLADTESQLATARSGYNDATSTLNQLVATFPWLLFTGMAGVRRRDFYEAPAGHEAPPRVEL